MNVKTIQTIVEFSSPGNFDTDITRLIDESRVRSAQHIIYLLGKEDLELMKNWRKYIDAGKFVTGIENEPDQEVKDYCASQTDRSAKLTNDLKHIMGLCLSKGVFVFRGKSTAVDNLDQEFAGSI